MSGRTGGHSVVDPETPNNNNNHQPDGRTYLTMAAFWERRKPVKPRLRLRECLSMRM